MATLIEAFANLVGVKKTFTRTCIMAINMENPASRMALRGVRVVEISSGGDLAP